MIVRFFFSLFVLTALGLGLLSRGSVKADGLPHPSIAPNGYNGGGHGPL